MAGELGYDTGPFVTLAVFCERTIKEADGVLSLIRVVDRLELSGSGPDAPDELPPGAVVNTHLVIGLKPGAARGPQKVQVVMEHPDGVTRKDGPEIPIHFTGDQNAGQNLDLEIGIVLSGPGTYYADVFVNGRLVTRTPLEVRYSVNPPGIERR